jgi:hypothetical protein
MRLPQNSFRQAGTELAAGFGIAGRTGAKANSSTGGKSVIIIPIIATN